MTTSTYVQCFLVAFIGMLLQATLKAVSIQKKAKLANVEFKFIHYLTQDWLSHLASVLTIFLFLFFIDEFVNFNAKVADFLKIGFAFVGYTGADIASRLFSVVNSRVNAAIDYKTTLADTQTGNLDKPTPAAKP